LEKKARKVVGKLKISELGLLDFSMKTF